MPEVISRLDEVCSITMGQAPSGDAYNSTGTGWPLIAGAGDFSNGMARAKKYTTEASKLSTDGDIVLGIRASIGAKVWSDGVYCLGRGVAGLRPRPGLDVGYLWYWLTHATPTLAAKGKGATFKQVNREDIGEMPIVLPPLAEQRRIAAILDQADALRAKRREALGHLDDLTQSIFLDMFGEEQTNPVLLGDHLTFVTSGGRGWAKYYAEHGRRFIRSLDVRMNSVGDTDSVYVEPPDNAEARRTAVKEGDVLLTITGSRIGRVSAVPARLGGAFVSQHVAILRPDHRTCRSEFLAFVLSLPMVGQRQIASFQYGQTKPGLNFEQIRGFSVPVPSIVAQDEFLRRLTTAGELRIRGDLQESLVDDLFASLQGRAFSGRL
jgi:type I restriction enzyme S subunit